MFTDSVVGSLGSATVDTTMQLDEIAAAESRMQVREGSAFCLAWAVVLYEYLMHESDEVAFDAVVLPRREAAAVRLCDLGQGTLCAESALSAISRDLHGASVAVEGPSAVLYAKGATRDAAFGEARAVFAESPLTLAGVLHKSAGNTASLSMLASNAVHIEESAKVQLRQVAAVLETIVRDAKANLLSSSVYNLALQGLVHPCPQHVHNDMNTEGGIATERLEDQFKRRAQAMPDTLALACCTAVDADGSNPVISTWTYAQLDRRSDEICTLLWAYRAGYAGADEGDQVVTLCMAKTLEMYATILGVLKAGATWCPIDPGWPKSRQEALITKSGAHVVLIAGDDVASAFESVRPHGVDVVRVDVAHDLSSVATPPRSALRASPEQLAYKIWTSGTTGLPKAVGIQHTAAVQGMRALCEAVPTTFSPQPRPGQIRFLQFAAYVFDLSIFDIFYTFAYGGTVCFAPLDLLLTRLVPVADALQVTHTLFTPAVSAMVPRHSIPSMRVVINGGEKLSEVVADEWTKNCRLVNIYGPAEATLSVTMHDLPPHDPFKAHVIGYALPTALCVIMDKYGNVAPRGAIGELMLGGPQLARGYIGDEDKTADKFVQHPTLGRLYHTGDLARCLWDGQYEYLGRDDDQVKINGVRIELLEINAAVKSISDLVRDADTAAMQNEDVGAPPKIVSFVVFPLEEEHDAASPLVRTDPDALLLAKELRGGAQKLLPSYMVPSHFIVLRAFPRTSSAKIDRVAVKNAYTALDLVQWEQQLVADTSTVHLEEDARVLLDPLARAVRERIPTLCPVSADQITARIPFPVLGLNSVRAMALSAQLSSAGFDVSAADLARHDSLARLVAHKARGGDVAAARRAHFDALCASYTQTYGALVQHAVGGRAVQILPTTTLQSSMLMESHVDASRYWLHRLVPVRGTLSLDALQAATLQLIREFDCLRMGFVEVRASAAAAAQASPYTPLYVTAVWDTYEPTVPCVPLTTTPQDASALLQTVVPHAPTNGTPPMHVVLLSGAQPYVALVLHHALYDATTVQWLGARLDQLCAKAPATHDPPLPFRTALGDLVPLDAAEERATLQKWDAALAAYPRDMRLVFPSLAERAPQAHGLARRTYRAKTRWSAMEDAAVRIGSSVRPLAQLAWARVLCAMMDTECILLGDAVSQRNARASYADVDGPLLATLAVPIDLRGGASVAQCAKRLHRFHIQMLDHAHVPLPYIRQQIACPRDRPLFESLFLLETDVEDAPHALLDFPCAVDAGLAVEHAIALEVRVLRDGALELALNWHASQISASYAQLLLEQMDAILDAYARSTDMPVLRHTLTDPSLCAAPPTAPALPTPWANVAHCVAHHAATWPVRDAVECVASFAPYTHVTCSYAALHEASAALGAALGALCERGAVIAVALPRSIETYVALVGILRAGMVYLPLDESLPDARRRLLVEDSNAALVLSDRGAVPWTSVRVESVAALQDAGARAPRPPTPPPTQPSDAAYILYTSGSTGKPKGCILTHANLAAAISNFACTFEQAKPGTLARARFLARSAEAFDVHLLEAFVPLAAGATVVTMPRSLLLEDLGRAMAATRVTHACVVPSLFFTQGRRIVPEDVPSLCVLLVGGEKMASDIVRVWGASPIPVLNAYGPTEATIGSSCAHVGSDALASQIGAAFPGNQYVVLAGNDRHVAMRGEVGELCIVGSHVGRGYLGEESAAAFFYYDGKPAYATGDRARIGPSGAAEYVGRIGSSQVKVRGARVELDEVDVAVQSAARAQFPHAATLLLTHPQHPEPHLVAFLAHTAHAVEHELPAVRPDADSVAALQSALRRQLSTYMVPSVFVPLTYLCLASVSGKVDRRALRALYEAQPLDALLCTPDDAAPSSARERAIAAVVEDVLAPSIPLRMHTDLYGVGLDSLRAVRLVHALHAHAHAISLAALLATPTLHGILAAVAETTPGADAAERSDVERRAAAMLAVRRIAVTDVYPCVPLQQGTLAQTLGSPAKRLYINHVRMQLAPDARSGALQQWSACLARYPIFATLFVEVEPGECVQAVLAKPPALGSSIDAPCTPAACDAIADAMIADVFSAPLVRLTLFSDLLVLSMHHAVYDASSLAHVFAAMHAPHASRPTPSFAAFSRTVASAQQSATQYWATALKEYSRAPLPCMTGHYDDGDANASCTLRAALSLSALRAAAQTHRVTLHAMALAAFATVLAAYLGENSFILGLVLSGRTSDVHHAEVPGPCITTVPFACERHDTLLDTVRATHDKLRALLPHQFVDLAAVRRALRADGPLFDVLFNFLPDADPLLPPGVTHVADEMETGMPLALEVRTHDASDTVTLYTAYATASLPAAQAQLLLAQVDDVLQRIVVEHTTPARLCSVVHATPTQPTDADAFLVRFARHAAACPDADAITFASSFAPLVAETLSYCELDRQSTACAEHLAAAPGDAVFVHLPRSMSSYVCLLAAWKARKTYVPLDPTLPKERLTYMMDTVGPGLLLTADAAFSPHGVLLASLGAMPRAPLPSPTLDTPAYILFTSGSTGKPKGVQIGHRALAAAILSWDAMLPHSPDSRMLQLASPGFDVSLFEICLPLALGFAMASAPKERLLDDLELAMRALRITVADLPAALASLVHPSNLPPLEWLMSGGDVIDERVVHTWSTPPQRLINAYGPTEGTIGNTLGFMHPNTRRSVVGHAYPTSTLYVLRGDELVYAGGVGELVVAGPQVADAYCRAPELTAAKFPTLFGSRAYRTGDRGRILADGRVECLGRMERGQVKINGQRVELDEIAHELAVEPHILDANVQYLQHPTHPAKQLVAFLAVHRTPAPPASQPLALLAPAESAQIAAACVQGAQLRLAPYMLPAHLLLLAHALPLTPNNKIDVHRLAALYLDMDPALFAPRRAAHTSAVSPTERVLLDTLAAFLHTENVDRDASFYALGLDSLSAIRLVRDLAANGVRISVAQLLHAATPHRAAASLESAAGLDDPSAAYAALLAAPAFAAVRARVQAPLHPATALQAGMLTSTLASHGRLYVHMHGFAVPASADECAAAWTRIVDMNEMLRTTFHATDDPRIPYLQAVHAHHTPAIHVHHGDPQSTLASCPAHWTSAEALAAAPLHTLHLFVGRETRCVLVLHHALYDAHALSELLYDWNALLQRGDIQARPPFSTLLPHLCTGASHVPYWVETLQHYRPTPMLPRGAALDACTAAWTLPTSPDKARRVCRDVGVSMHALATLAFAHLLAHLHASSDVCFGQVLSLRGDVPDAERVIGPALNTVPTRIRLRGSAHAMLRAVQDSTDAARAHRTAPLRDITACLAKQGLGAPLFDALLDVQHHTDEAHTPLLAPFAMDSVEDNVQYALNLEFIHHPQRLGLVATARTAFADADKLHSLLQYMGTCVEEILDDATHAAPPAAPLVARRAHQDAPRAILDPLREILADVAHVLVDQVTPTTPLLALGLDSIAAIRIAALARARGLPLQMRDIAAGADATEVALEYLARAEAPVPAPQQRAPCSLDEAAAALGMPAHAYSAVLPVAPGQAYQLAVMVASSYREGLFSFAYRVERLDAPRLRTAWTALVERHAILRTVFVGTAQGLAQVQCTDTYVPPFATHRAARAAQGIDEVMRAQRTVENALTTPCARLAVIHAADGDVMVLTLLHAMYDACSLQLLVADLEALYLGTPLASVPGILPLLAAPPSSDEIRMRFGAYAAAAPCMLGTVAPPAAHHTFVQLPNALASDALRHVTQQHAVPLASLFVAAWAHVVHRATNTTPILGMLQLARATIPDADRLAAPCVNMVPLAVPVQPTLLQTAFAAHAALRHLQPLEQTSLAAIHDALGLPMSPRFNAVLNILRAEDAPPHAHFCPIQDAGLDTLADAAPIAQHSSLEAWPQLACYASTYISVDVRVESAQISFALRCPANVLDTATAEQLLYSLRATLQSMDGGAALPEEALVGTV
ncbi:Nonribosomal Peptide Synthase (NRPS) [Malassezia vespertilionis]|uniref:Nonribosomal Peptide Synthase (NRPS) n=2 Tax=Malassezia vespertilionis TaxID=2020962 RepID=A0A2N1JAB4_9BASI|nr:Nonribosomal Peptide Synthase (NRPS) [Malassezia vespertilionis]